MQNPNELFVTKEFATRLIETMISDYISNAKTIKQNKNSDAVQLANLENAEFKQYLLLDTEKPLLDLLELSLGMNSSLIRKSLLGFLARIDEELGLVESGKISSQNIVKTAQTSLFELLVD